MAPFNSWLTPIDKSLIGQRFGRLTVIEKTNERKNKYIVYFCKCDCGNITKNDTYSLTSGHTKSCGCLRKNYIIHGMSGTKINKTYQNMKSRCYNPNSSKYYLYGGKGIKICELNKETGFINFYSWAMQNGYKEGLTIDRIDSDKDYEPSNCRWATYKEQNSHLKNNPFCGKIIEYNGEAHSLKKWSEIKNISYDALLCRYERNWDIKRMLETPTGQYIRSGKYKKGGKNADSN